jgi:hypothetical protein
VEAMALITNRLLALAVNVLQSMQEKHIELTTTGIYLEQTQKLHSIKLVQLIISQLRMATFQHQIQINISLLLEVAVLQLQDQLIHECNG